MNDNVDVSLFLAATDHTNVELSQQGQGTTGSLGYVGDTPVLARYIGDERIIAQYIGDTLIYSEQ
jgi:hypothetical protein